MSPSMIKEITVKPLEPEFQTQPKKIEKEILVQPFKIEGATFEALLLPQCGIRMALMKVYHLTKVSAVANHHLVQQSPTCY